MRTALIALACLALLGACDVAETVETPELYERPADVKALFIRAEECQHWAGEEAYNPERGKEILQAVHRLRCEQLDEEYVALRQKYSADDAVSKDMEETNITNDFEFSYPPK